MRLDSPLDDIFRSRSHVRVLRALCDLPQSLPASAREVARRAGLSHPTAAKVLASLADQGIVVRQRVPGADAFELRRDHIAAEKISMLMAWERGLRRELLSVLRAQILRRSPSIDAAFLFGSVAQGDSTPTSDIDVAVICPPEARETVAAAMEDVGESVRARFGNRLSVVLGTASLDELQRLGRKGSRLWRQIIRDGIPIIEPEGRSPGA